MRGGEQNALKTYNKIDLIQRINGMLSKYDKSLLTSENTRLLNKKDTAWLKGHLEFLKEQYEPQPKKEGLFW